MANACPTVTHVKQYSRHLHSGYRVLLTLFFLVQGILNEGFSNPRPLFNNVCLKMVPRVSIKLVVEFLLAATSGIVIFCTSLPLSLQLQDDAIDFVFGALASSTGTVQMMVRRRLSRMELVSDIMYRASRGGTLMENLFEFADWAAPAAIGLQIEASLFTADGRGVRVTYENTAGIAGARRVHYESDIAWSLCRHWSVRSHHPHTSKPNPPVDTILHLPQLAEPARCAGY